jgi:hypothetical protein
MDPTTLNMNPLHVLAMATCELIDELIRTINATSYQSTNLTYSDYLTLLRSPHCIPKPYISTQGIKRWTILILLGCFLLLGLIGNLLSASIMFRRSRRGLTSYFYLASLAIIDIFILLNGCLPFFIEVAFEYRLELSSNTACRLLFYNQHLFTYISAWLIVTVTFERFIIVRFPLQSIRLCRLPVAYKIVSTIVLLFAIYTTHGFFTVGIIRIHLQTDNGYHPDYHVCDIRIYQRALAILDLCFYSVLPSLFILILNLLIIYTVFYAMKQRHAYLQGNSDVRTSDMCPKYVQQKPKSSSSIRMSPFVANQSSSEYDTFDNK